MRAAEERWEIAQGEITYSDADFTFPHTKYNEFMVVSQLLLFLPHQELHVACCFGLTRGPNLNRLPLQRSLLYVRRRTQEKGTWTKFFLSDPFLCSVT